MLAILGMNINEVENEVSSFSKDGVCEISNDNSNSQIVVSGERKTIEKFRGKMWYKKNNNWENSYWDEFHK